MTHRPVPRWIAASLCLMLCSGTAARAEDKSPPHAPAPASEGPATDDAPGAEASDDAIRQWIVDLDSDRYEVRERASRNLVKLGTAALQGLGTAAGGQRPEAAARAIDVLEELGNREDDPQLQLGALELLTKLENRPAVSSRALRKLSEVWEQIALPQALELGGRFDPNSLYYDTLTGQERLGMFIVGPKWKGGDEGLKNVARLGFVHTVSVRRAPVSTEGLIQLADMPSLIQLQLYGLDLDDEQSQVIREAFPHVNLDFRGSAMLGVRGSNQTEFAQIINVEPDSAAEQAGLHPGDVITQVDGVTVQSFADLTTEIGKRNAGDTATLQVRRSGELLDRKVTFRGWE